MACDEDDWHIASTRDSPLQLEPVDIGKRNIEYQTAATSCARAGEKLGCTPEHL